MVRSVSGRSHYAEIENVEARDGEQSLSNADVLLLTMEKDRFIYGFMYYRTMLICEVC